MQRLKQGLTVSAGSGNLITFAYEDSLHKRQVPLDKPGNILNHRVVEQAYWMMEAEFRSVTSSQWQDADVTLKKEGSRIQEQLAKVNAELYDLDGLMNLQMHFLSKEDGREPQDKEDKRSQYWSDPFLGVRQHSIHIRRMQEYEEKIRGLGRDLDALKVLLPDLQARINDPRAQYIRTERRIERGDPPEVVILKQQRQAKLLDLRKLMERNTEKHPQVVRLKQEIEEIDSQLRQSMPQFHSTLVTTRASAPQAIYSTTIRRKGMRLSWCTTSRFRCIPAIFSRRQSG